MLLLQAFRNVIPDTAVWYVSLLWCRLRFVHCISDALISFVINPTMVFLTIISHYCSPKTYIRPCSSQSNILKSLKPALMWVTDSMIVFFFFFFWRGGGGGGGGIAWEWFRYNDTIPASHQYVSRYSCAKPRLIDNGTCRQPAITRTTILVPCHVVKSLQLIWRSGTRRFYLRVPDLQMSCRDLT